MNTEYAVTSCLRRITKMAWKAIDACVDEESSKCSRDVDMPTCVAAVKATIFSKVPLSFFDNNHVQYLNELSLSIPHHIGLSM